MDRDDRQLDELFAAYKGACPAPDLSAEFMPGLWDRIDASRSFTVALRRWAGAFVAAAAVVCIAMVFYFAAYQPVVSPVYTTTYVDTLGNGEPFETLAYAEVVSYEPAASMGER